MVTVSKDLHVLDYFGKTLNSAFAVKYSVKRK